LEKFTALVNAGESEKSAARRARQFLFARAPFLAASRDALLKAFTRRFAALKNANGDVKALRDGRANNGNRVEIPTVEIERMRHSAMTKCGGRINAAWREEYPLLSEKTRTHYPDQFRCPAKVYELVNREIVNALHARHHGGRFILRIEDTDRERSTEEAVGVILDGMRWLNLDADEGPYFQSQRYERYRAVIAQLLERGAAYRCYCTREELEAMRLQQLTRKEKPRYDGRCREIQQLRPGVAPAIRFKNPLDGEVIIDDQVHGRVVFHNRELDDLIIERSDGNPTYNFCVVVDDMDMGVTHVIRGDDHLNNTPRQINMLRALGAPFPDVLFCPTGGITRASAPDYLELPNVVCVGGSWIAPRAMLAAGDWAGIEALARDAAGLKRA
jgi:hypothetical protein